MRCSILSAALCLLILGAADLQRTTSAADVITSETARSGKAAMHRPLIGATYTHWDFTAEKGMNDTGLVATYHLPGVREKARAHLAAMRAGGVQTLDLLLWHMSDPSGHRWGVIPSARGLEQPWRGNLELLLTDVREAGFERLLITFGPQWRNVPTNYEGTGKYDPALFEENYRMIREVRAIAKRCGPPETRLDLIGEGAPPDPVPERCAQMRSYAMKMWQRYVGEFGKQDAMISSIAPQGGEDEVGRLRNLIELFRQSGAGFPRWFSFSLYPEPGSEEQTLRILQGIDRQLREAGLPNQPILIRETWLDNENVARAIARFNRESARPVEEVMQWYLRYTPPGARTQAQTHWNTPPPYSAGCYGRLFGEAADQSTTQVSRYTQFTKESLRFGETSGSAETAPFGDPTAEVGSPKYLAFYVEPATPYSLATGCAMPGCKAYNKFMDLRWSAADPAHVYCAVCRTKYPNSRFPENHWFELGGERIRFHRGAQGIDHYFSGCLRYNKLLHALDDAQACATRYERTGERRCAEQARDILLAFARVYPGFFYARCPTMSAGKPPVLVQLPGDYGAGRIKQYFGDYGFPSIFCKIYRPIAKSDVISEEQRAAIRGLLECCVGDCVYPYFRCYRLTGNTAGQVLTDLVRAGRCFPDMVIHDRFAEAVTSTTRTLSGADLVHEAIEGTYGLPNLINNGFFTDGFWREGSLSYQQMVAGGIIQFLNEARGYSDPEDYRPVDPTWKRITDYEPPMEGFLGRCLSSLPWLALPDGGILPLADSHKKALVVPAWQNALRILTPEATVRVPENSDFFDGLGVAALRCGTGPTSAATFLTYGPRGTAGHSHLDQLNLTFYAKGHELVTDLGYPGSTDEFRTVWTRCTASHNTVVVDGQNQEPSCGRLDAFACSKHFQVVQASAAAAYPQLSDYRRTLILAGNRADARAPRYLVDVFHVAGGTTHDFVFHAQSEPELPEEKFEARGVALRDTSTSSITLTLQDLTSSSSERRPMGYHVVQLQQRGTAAAPWEARWHTGPDDLALRLMRLADEPEELLVGRVPGRRVYSGAKWEADYGKKMSWLCCRRAAAPDRPTVFVSVVEACRAEQPQLLSARLIAHDRRDGRVAVEVTHAAGRDVFVVSSRPTSGTLETSSSGEIATDARVSCLAFDPAGRLADALASDGTRLVAGGQELRASHLRLEGSVRGFPEGLEADPVVVEVDFDVPASARGSVLTMEHRNGSGSAWRIQRIESVAERPRRLVLDRRAVEGFGVIGRTTPDGRSLSTDTGFQLAEGGMAQAVHQGAWIVAGDESHLIRSVAVHERWEPFLYEVSLATPLGKQAGSAGQRFVWTRVHAGDRVVIQPDVQLSSSSLEKHQSHTEDPS